MFLLTSSSCRAKEDVAVLGLHDIKFLPVQTILVDKVFNPPQKTGFPPKSDLALLHLSVAARLGEPEPSGDFRFDSEKSSLCPDSVYRF